MNALIFAKDLEGCRATIVRERGRVPYARVGQHKSLLRARTRDGQILHHGDRVLITGSTLHTDVYVERI